MINPTTDFQLFNFNKMGDKPVKPRELVYLLNLMIHHINDMEYQLLELKRKLGE